MSEQKKEQKAKKTEAKPAKEHTIADMLKEQALINARIAEQAKKKGG